MNKEQYDVLVNKNKRKTIHVDKDFPENFNGTLLFGSIANDGDMFHFYIKDGFLNLLRYFRMGGEYRVDEHIKSKEICITDIIEDKRIFPEASSWNFSVLLDSRKESMTFASYDHTAPQLEEGTFYPLAWEI